MEKKSPLIRVIFLIKEFFLIHNRTNQVTIDSFKFLRFLGMGAYGVVWLVEHKQTKDLYAMKIIDAEDAVIFSLLYHPPNPYSWHKTECMPWKQSKVFTKSYKEISL